MLNTLLFDLDGTLLPLDLTIFMKAYFAKLVPRLDDFYEPTQAVERILQATHQVIGNEYPQLSNADKFRRALFGNRSDEEQQVWSIFEQFYDTSFEELRDLTIPTKIAREICRTAQDKDYRLVLATNPIFPEAATRARMRWAGLDDISFELVTTLENSHYCKPNPKYYLEILDKLDALPNQCMMIGNDVQEDGAASHVGIQTYLVTDCLVDHNLGTFHFDEQGTLAELQRYVEALPVVEV